MSWIDADKELPKNTDCVLVGCWYGGVNYGLMKAYNVGGNWFVDKDSIDIDGDAYVSFGFDITHWQPLPEPPK